MKYGFILMNICILLFGCSGTSSFEGKLFENKKGYLIVDCSDEVNKGENNVKDLGYLCKVLVTGKTAFFNENGKKLNANELSEGANLKIVLVSSDKISKKEDTREVEAKEIHIHND
ncbi:hypothetical protein [Fictibacillus barbaricus]|uniref:DUF3221 domain-containing protein n=1 Tax=Fictibacillus barbaricus TaxID=182136 RepID=A0ABS2ZDN4_9BACL|nr:hypothetical protein [Fictibacillus barbaricus]MBN3545454.1 hypothetical protein [Fictibacillus barbaricus]GGB53535.1 hypothetical protein GCM10007199_19010 [Fictibacillus barbaricus]